MVTTTIISAKTDTGSALDTFLRQTGLVASVRHRTLERCQNMGASVSDVIILDVSRDADSCLALAARLRESYPNVLLIGWSPDQPPTAELLLLAMRSGVQEFLSTPVDPVRLREVLARSIKSAEPNNAAQESGLTVVMGVKGGVGGTTVAVNIGVQLAKLAQKQVALLDFACPLGHASVFLDLYPRFTLRDAVENLDRLDEHFLSGLLMRHESGLSLLAGTSDPLLWERLPASALPQVVKVAQSTSDFVLIDYNCPYLPGSSAVLKEAHTLVLVATVDSPSLANLERWVSALTSMGVDPERLRIVFNRWYAMRDVGCDQALERILEKTKCSVLARLPNDFQQVSQAITQGAPLSKNEKDPLCAQYRELARQLAGVVVAPEQKESQRSPQFVPLKSAASVICG